MVDVVAFVWPVSANSGVKKVAAAAGAIGVIRVVAPQLAVGLYAARIGGQGSDPACAVSVFLLVPLAVLILTVSALAAAFMLWRVTRAATG